MTFCGNCGAMNDRPNYSCFRCVRENQIEQLRKWQPAAGGSQRYELIEDHIRLGVYVCRGGRKLFIDDRDFARRSDPTFK